MLNYKVDVDSIISPASYYGSGSFDSHFAQIGGWGFNCVRLCIDVQTADSDTAAMFRSLDRVLDTAALHGLRVMLLIKPPLDEHQVNYTAGLLRHFSSNPTIWAYDFMNEPLYFDPVSDRPKLDAYRIVDGWRSMMVRYAPHQLFTIGFSEPIEVFEWDPSILPVDFVEIHTYHPLRVAAEIYWYAHYVKRPFIIGETSLPADNDSVPYEWQAIFMRESYQCAVANGAIGYGWWEFQDYPDGINFEAQRTGLRDERGAAKPAAAVVASLRQLPPDTAFSHPPVNYFNMLGYHNFDIDGTVIDADTRKPIEGAVIRAGNDDWSVGLNTFSNQYGHFSLTSNDICTHFIVSAPGMETLKFSRCYDVDEPLDWYKSQVSDRLLEYQRISYEPFLQSHNSMLRFEACKFGMARFGFANIVGKVKLHRLKSPKK